MSMLNQTGQASLAALSRSTEHQWKEGVVSANELAAFTLKERTENRRALILTWIDKISRAFGLRRRLKSDCCHCLDLQLALKFIFNCNLYKFNTSVWANMCVCMSLSSYGRIWAGHLYIWRWSALTLFSEIVGCHSSCLTLHTPEDTYLWHTSLSRITQPFLQ